MTEPEYLFHVGIDWASESHKVCIVAHDSRRTEHTVPHSSAGLAALATELVALYPEDPGRVAIAIEVPRGPVVATLLERGLHVFALNPKQLDRFRDRHTVAGAKDDRRDGFVLADSLRTDQPAFRRVHLEDPVLVELRELSRLDDDLREELSRLSNRLRDQLHRFCPDLLTLCPAADEPWFWALLAQALTPSRRKPLSLKTVTAVLKAHRIRRLTAETVHTALQVPFLRVAPGTVEAACAHIALLLPRLRLVHDQRTRTVGPRLEALLAALGQEEVAGEHRDVTILRSLPGVGRLVAATVLAEAARPLAERDYQTLRAQAGVAPVTRQSGKKAQVSMRLACNRRLRNAVYHWARVSIGVDPRCRAHYDRLRQGGHQHARALRGVADRSLGVLLAMLASRTLYDAERRCQKAA
ncbi:MAG TPA: IS110 family transposase [Candidatus Binatia bacterium]|nr:IS110 family transposase [Candidatus Binatia bacterium]